MDATRWLDDVEERVDDRLDDGRIPRALTVLYDPTCSLCRRCRGWMEGQRRFVRVTWLACTAEEARKAYGDIPWLQDELVVVGDGGEVWVGPAAFLVCLWALVDWREWSFRLAGPAFAPLAERFFLSLSPAGADRSADSSITTARTALARSVGGDARGGAVLLAGGEAGGGLPGVPDAHVLLAGTPP